MANLIFYPILGQPLFAWGGLVTLILILSVALLGFLVGKGKAKISWHVNLARIAILLALLHGLAAVLFLFRLI